MLAPTPASPESVGMSEAALARVEAHLKTRYIDAGRFPGTQLLVYRRGKVVHNAVQGFADVERKAPVRDDTIFRIYSMTKPMTTVAALMLLEEGAIALDDPVSRYIPAFADLKVHAGGAAGHFVTRDAARPMTVLDLMRHTSGLTYGFLYRTSIDAEYRRLRIAEPDLEGGLPEMMRLLATLPLEFSPGEAFNYSVSTDVLGHVMEIASGQRLSEFFHRRILGPLGMGDTGFFVPEDRRQRLATCYWSKDDRLALWDDGVKTMRYGAPPALESGGGGLAGTASDYLRFARMLLNKGELGGTRYLSPKTVRNRVSDVLAKLHAGTRAEAVAMARDAGIGESAD